MTEQIFENNLIKSLASKFLRAPNQLNKTFESDVEIIKANNMILAATTDSIAEEIESGLYNDPYLTGWMIVNVNFSDIAASGANLLGILISEIIPSSFKEEDLKKMQNGIKDACEKLNSYVLGGDTNFGEKLILTGTALGFFDDKKFLTRKGCCPNQILYSTNKLGRGNAFAITQLLNNNKEKIKYLPIARLKESKFIKKFASACMDTSDGVISTLDQLMRINNCGFELNEDWQSTIDDESKTITEKNGIPLWLLLAGQHGEFELLFTIDPDKEKKFLAEAELINWQPIKIGKVITEPAIKINIYGKLQTLNSTEIRNLSFNQSGGIDSYLNALLKIDKDMR